MSQQVIATVVEMLSDERIERRCAAAMVLGALRVKDQAAVARLAECLSEEESPLHGYALEALAAMRAKNIAAQVTPLLDSKNEEIRGLATALLAGQGKRATAALSRQLAESPPARQRAIVAIIARNHDRETFDRLLDYLGEPALGEAVVQNLRSELEHMDAAASAALQQALGKLLKHKEWMAEPEQAARTVRLLGYFREPRLVQALLPFAAARHPVAVRLAALAGLRRPLQAARSTTAALKAMLEHAADDDPTVARAAVDTLRVLQLDSAALVDELASLARGRHAEARRWAVEVLGRSRSPLAIGTLIEHLVGDDPATREAAARALVRADGAVAGLTGELRRLVDQPESLARLCQVLRPHASDFDASARKVLGGLALSALEAGKPAAEPLLALLRVADATSFATLLAAEALRHRRAKRFPQAFDLLGRLDEAGLLDEEGRYAALVSGLCANSSNKELGRASRTTDPVLRQAVALVSRGFPLASRLRREKAVEDDALFFVGFNFSESRDEDERAFGGELLTHLVTRSPRSKLGRSARNKMRLVGLEA